MPGTSSANVSVGKPNLKVSGGILTAPLGTTRATDTTAALDRAYVSLGYVGEDGVTETSERSTEVIRAWGGRKVRTVQTEHGTSLQFTLIESRNANTLKFIYGEDNVTVSGTGVKIRRNEKTLPHVQVVVDMLDEANGRRLDVGNGQVTEVGDVTFVDGEAISYEVTLSCDPDKNGDTLVEYAFTGEDGSGE
ncbi:MAG: phage tail protein [Galactobacter sp.]